MQARKIFKRAYLCTSYISLRLLQQDLQSLKLHGLAADKAKQESTICIAGQEHLIRGSLYNSTCWLELLAGYELAWHKAQLSCCKKHIPVDELCPHACSCTGLSIMYWQVCSSHRALFDWHTEQNISPGIGMLVRNACTVISTSANEHPGNSS